MEDIEDTDYVASEHDRLVSAVTKLDKTQYITEPTRNEPTNLNSEFSLLKRTNKLDLSNVAKILEDTAHNVNISKKIKASQNVSKVLPKPLEKPQVERIKRATGYEAAKIKVGRWDAVVARNRTVDYVSFPLKSVPPRLQPTSDFLSKLTLKSPLEKELDEVDPKPIVEESQEEQVYPMSYQEMLEHRQHLAKIRAQQSYKAAKAKRQSKIKSKKYHRILKKEKLKQQLKEFEELQTKDPEEAFKKLQELEKARALERHTLRHKNTGKWAKNKLIRAKYDKEVRQQLAEQLAVSRGLTHKTQDVDSSDDEPDDTEVVPDLTLSQDPMNPWMLKKPGKSNIDEEFNFGYKKYLKDKMYKRKLDADSESEVEDEKIQNDKTEQELKTTRGSINSLMEEKISNEVSTTKLMPEKEDINNTMVGKNVNKKRRKINTPANKPVGTTKWVVESVESNNAEKENDSLDITSAFESLEDKVVGQVKKKLEKLRDHISILEKSSKNNGVHKVIEEISESSNLDNLKLYQKKKAIIDDGLLETNSRTVESVEKLNTDNMKGLKPDALPAKENVKMDIDPSRFIEVKPKYLNTALSKNENCVDELDDDEQVVPKVDIGEVFEEDDVVASFRQEKEDERNKDQPQAIDLSLPGWGNWGGKGVKAPKRKKNRFITKLPPKMPRRDDNKGDIIIKEFKDPKLTAHKITDVPFPFTSVKDYEASIRTPLGNIFIPETAHKKLIRPSVITKAGTIIEPMDEEELLVKKNLTFKNQKIIKLLAKK